MSGESKVMLQSSDDTMFEVDAAVAYESTTIKDVMEDSEPSIIPLRQVPAKVLEKVLEYCKYHVELRKSSERGEAVPDDDAVKQWDAEFINVPYPALAKLISAANYLYIKNLLELGGQAVADMIKGKTAAEIREAFGIKNDFTPAEEAEIIQENQWTTS